jgi:hypothetical protein
MKQEEEEDFKFVKIKKDHKKRNYIFQRDKLTKYVFYFIATVLIILILALILSSLGLMKS